MSVKRPIITCNIAVFVFIIIYFYFNITSNFSFRHSFYVYTTLLLRSNVSNQVNDSSTRFGDQPFVEMTAVVKNVSHSTNFSEFNEIELRVKRADEYLKKLSKFKRIRSNSQLIYPKELSEMTEMTISDNHCSQQLGKDLLILVLVFSRVEGFQRRQTIRETWGHDINANNKSRIYFTVGLTHDMSVQQKVVEENQKFGDILQFGYYESYYNCTIKAVGLLRWTALNCPFVKFMLKIDDDSLILTKNLIKFVDKTVPDTILGFLWSKPRVFRDKSKWALSKQDYPPDVYPDYIAGPYLIPGRYVLSLYETVINKCLPALPFEDVYITGVVANETLIPRKKNPSLLFLWEGCKALELDFCYYQSFSIFWQHLNDNQIRKLWQIYQKGDVCPSNGGQHC